MSLRVLGRRRKWQAPGNSKIFNSPFYVQQSDQTYIRDRSIEVLKYVRDNSPSPTNFVRNIKQYLSEKMDNFVNNNSIAIHFLKPLIFYGLVDEIIPEKDVYRDVITIDGTQFLMHYENGEYEEATKSFLHCLLRSKYSNNKATSRTKTPGLYPFRIIFYLLRMHGELLIDDFKRWIPFIQSKEDLDKNKFIKTDESYTKLHTWVINCLVDLKILSLTNGKYKINNFYNVDGWLNELSSLLEESSLFDKQETLQSEDEEESENARFGITLLLKNEVKKLNNWKCFINDDHPTFLSKVDNKPFLFIHHIIPVEYRASFPSFNINDVENLIPICSPCHTAIHHGNQEQTFQLVEIIFSRKREFLKQLNISPFQLLQMYNNTLP